MAFGNARTKEILAQCETEGEDKTRERLCSESISPDDRRLMQGWLDNISTKKNDALQKKNTLIQTWILRLTIAIFILTIVSVVFAILSYKLLDVQPHSQATEPQKENQAQQKGILESVHKATK